MMYGKLLPLFIYDHFDNTAYRTTDNSEKSMVQDKGLVINEVS